VRQKAVVRFSRTHQTYKVDYGDYDGGGHIPGIDAARRPEADEQSAAPNSLGNLLGQGASEEKARKGAQAAGENLPRGGDAAHASSLVDEAPCAQGNLILQSSGTALEEMDDWPACPTSGPGRRAPGRTNSGPWEAGTKELQVQAVANVVATASCVGDSAGEDADDGASSTGEGLDDAGGEDGAAASDGSDIDETFFDQDSSYPPAAGWSQSPFVRAWGVLTNWLSNFALDVLHGARFEHYEEGRPAHKGRRDLLVDLLSSRLPGELSSLAPRFHNVIAALSVHQTLPSVTESSLYDLLAALILRTIHRIDVREGREAASSHCELVLDQQVQAAAHRLGISDSELHGLDALFK